MAMEQLGAMDKMARKRNKRDKIEGKLSESYRHQTSGHSTGHPVRRTKVSVPGKPAAEETCTDQASTGHPAVPQRPDIRSSPEIQCHLFRTKTA